MSPYLRPRHHLFLSLPLPFSFPYTPRLTVLAALLQLVLSYLSPARCAGDTVSLCNLFFPRPERVAIRLSCRLRRSIRWSLFALRAASLPRHPSSTESRFVFVDPGAYRHLTDESVDRTKAPKCLSDSVALARTTSSRALASARALALEEQALEEVGIHRNCVVLLFCLLLRPFSCWCSWRRPAQPININSENSFIYPRTTSTLSEHLREGKGKPPASSQCLTASTPSSRLWLDIVPVWWRYHIRWQPVWEHFKWLRLRRRYVLNDQFVRLKRGGFLYLLGLLRAHMCYSWAGETPYSTSAIGVRRSLCESPLGTACDSWTCARDAQTTPFWTINPICNPERRVPGDLWLCFVFADICSCVDDVQ